MKITNEPSFSEVLFIIVFLRILGFIDAVYGGRLISGELVFSDARVSASYDVTP